MQEGLINEIKANLKGTGIRMELAHIMDYFDGISLFPAIIKEDLEDDLFAVSQRVYLNDIVDSSIRSVKWKWHREGIFYKGTLFDLENDPGEKDDVSEEYPEVVEYLENRLNDIIYSNKLIHVELKDTKRIEIDDTLKKQLKSLGYLQ